MRASATSFLIPLLALLVLPAAAEIAAPEQDEKCGVAGVVVAAGTGTPLAGAEISIYRNEVASPPIVVKSDPTGHYVVTDLEPGHYSLSAEHRGYLTQMYGQPKRNREGTAVMLEPGKKCRALIFGSLRLVRFRVLGKDIEPVVGATVEAFAPRCVAFKGPKYLFDQNFHHDYFFKTSFAGNGMPHQVDVFYFPHMSGTELSRVRTELRLLPPAPINQSVLASRGAAIVMQSSPV